MTETTKYEQPMNTKIRLCGYDFTEKRVANNHNVVSEVVSFENFLHGFLLTIEFLRFSNQF